LEQLGSDRTSARVSNARICDDRRLCKPRLTSSCRLCQCIAHDSTSQVGLTSRRKLILSLVPKVEDEQGGADVMRVWTEVNGEILEAQYPTERLALQYALLIVRNDNREAYMLALKYIVTVVMSFSRSSTSVQC
jgi:hypothetical protein